MFGIVGLQNWRAEESSSSRSRKIVLLRKEINHCVSSRAPAGEIKKEEKKKKASAPGCWWEEESATTVTFKQLLEAISQIWFASLSGKSWPHIHKDITLHPVSAAIHGSSHFPHCCCYGSYYLHPTRKRCRELKNNDLMMLLYACMHLKLKCIISVPLASNWAVKIMTVFKQVLNFLPICHRVQQLGSGTKNLLINGIYAWKK